MKTKKLWMIFFAVALLASLFSIQTFAASQYTITIKSNDGAQVLWTATVDSGTKMEIMTYGVCVDRDALGANDYVYSGGRQFLGFATSANATAISSFYAIGYTKTITGNLTLYVVDTEPMGAHTIVGDPITGAEIYELWQKNAPMLNVHPELDNYILYRCKFKSGSDVKTVYGVLVSSHINDSCVSTIDSDGNVSLNFPDGNIGYYKTNFQSQEEALGWLLDSSHTIESFTQVKLRPSAYGGSIQSLESIYSSSSYKLNINNSSSGVTINFYKEPWAKIAESSTLLFDLDLLDLSAGSHTFKVKAKGAGYYDSDFSNEVTYQHIQKYSVTGNFTNLSAYGFYAADYSYSPAYHYRPLALQLIPSYGYLQPDEIVVTMGGTTLTAGSGYWYDPDSGVLIIPKVTGDVSITAQGLLKVAAPVIEAGVPEDVAEFYPIGLGFLEVAHASGYTVYIDGVAVDQDMIAMSAGDGVVYLGISKNAFSKSGTYDIYVIAQPEEGYMASNASNTVTVDVTVILSAPVIEEAPEFVTDEYLFAMRPASGLDPQVGGIDVYLDGVLYDGAVLDYVNGVILIPASAFVGGDGSFEIYVILNGVGVTSSAPSNTLTVTVAKLSTPNIWLQ